MYDQAWHPLSNQKKLILPSSTWDTTGCSFTHTIVVYTVRTYAPSLELVLYTTRQFPYAPSGAGNLTTSWQLVFRTEISLSLERTPFEGQVVHDRSLAIERFPQTALHAKHLATAPLIHNSELRLTLRPSLLRSAVNRGIRITPFKNSLKRSRRLT
jgi:hypothetical protein